MQDLGHNKEIDLKEPEPKQFLTLRFMSRAFALIEEGLYIFGSKDKHFERFSKFHHILIDDLRCYQEIYKEKNQFALKQSTLHLSFTKCLRRASSNVV